MFKSKNPYKPFICLEGLQCDEIGKAYEEGQQNPDPEQYAKREELVEEMEKLIVDEGTGKVAHILVNPKEAKVIIKILVDIICTHGLEVRMGKRCSELDGSESYSFQPETEEVK